MIATLAGIPKKIRNAVAKKVTVPDSPWVMAVRHPDCDFYMHFDTPGAANDKRIELEADGVTCSCTIYCPDPKDMSVFQDFLSK